MGQKISVVIPNYNGLELLKENLSIIISSTKKFDASAEFVLVDDASTDESVSYVKKEFPGVKIIKQTENRGFSSSVNNGIKYSKGEFIVLLNTDVQPIDGYLKSPVDIMKDNKVFAVSFHEAGYGWAKGYFKDGFVEHGVGGTGETVHETFWVSGGSGIFRKSLIQKLGGFDYKLFNPFYWEDLDICFRAMKRGYKLFWEPNSHVIHNHESTIGRIPKRKKDLVLQRNQLLFIWKNITSRVLFKRHIRGLFKRLSKHPGYIRVVMAALLKYAACREKRKIEIKCSKISDEAIFARFNN
jgi:GT2 family glycosyltransferase